MTLRVKTKACMSSNKGGRWDKDKNEKQDRTNKGGRWGVKGGNTHTCCLSQGYLRLDLENPKWTCVSRPEITSWIRNENTT